jgi:hypothetical protein
MLKPAGGFTHIVERLFTAQLPRPLFQCLPHLPLQHRDKVDFILVVAVGRLSRGKDGGARRPRHSSSAGVRDAALPCSGGRGDDACSHQRSHRRQDVVG